MRMTTGSSGLITTQAFTSPGAVCAAASLPNGTWKPSERPPVTAAVPTRKLRRETWVRSRTCSVMVMPSRSTGLAAGRRQLDRGADAVIGAAAADIGEAVVDVVVGRLRVVL